MLSNEALYNKVVCTEQIIFIFDNIKCSFVEPKKDFAINAITLINNKQITLVNLFPNIKIPIVQSKYLCINNLIIFILKAQ